jgi:hypothetical protein
MVDTWLAEKRFREEGSFWEIAAHQILGVSVSAVSEVQPQCDLPHTRMFAAGGILGWLWE